MGQILEQPASLLQAPSDRSSMPNNPMALPTSPASSAVGVRCGGRLCRAVSSLPLTAPRRRVDDTLGGEAVPMAGRRTCASPELEGLSGACKGTRQSGLRPRDRTGQHTPTCAVGLRAAGMRRCRTSAMPWRPRARRGTGPLPPPSPRLPWLLAWRRDRGIHA
jgi:hypothetical protein